MRSRVEETKSGGFLKSRPQAVARAKSAKKKFTSLRLESLEQRALLTSGANYIVLDFTPDQISNEIRPNDFVQLFTAADQAGSLLKLENVPPGNYQFLDFDEDGDRDVTDARIAANRIANDVRRRLKPLLDDPTIDVRLTAAVKNLATDQNEGQQWLNYGTSEPDVNTFVIYVGGHLQSGDYQERFRTWEGIAQQGFKNENHEWYAYALAERSALKAAQALGRVELVSAKTSTDDQSVFASLTVDPSSIDAKFRINVSSGNATFEDIRVGDRVAVQHNGKRFSLAIHAKPSAALQLRIRIGMD